MGKERIAVLGTGDVGRRLAGAFRDRGHQVMMGTRDPSRPEHAAWCRERDIELATFEVAAEDCDIAVLCTAWDGTENALRLAHAAHLDGKVLIDVTNPLRHTEAGPVLAIGHADSAGEAVQRWAPGASVVKCWNIVGNASMADPAFEEGPPTMWICGEDEEAKKRVRRILGDFGWEDVVDLGGIVNSRYLEPLAMVWIVTGARTGHWNQAFRMLRK